MLDWDFLLFGCWTMEDLLGAKDHESSTEKNMRNFWRKKILTEINVGKQSWSNSEVRRGFTGNHFLVKLTENKSWRNKPNFTFHQIQIDISEQKLNRTVISKVRRFMINYSKYSNIKYQTLIYFFLDLKIWNQDH